MNDLTKAWSQTATPVAPCSGSAYDGTGRQPATRRLEIKPMFYVIADISGYTRFLQRHSGDLVHAEWMVGELLEQIIASARSPLKLYEIAGDAVSFFAVTDRNGSSAQEVWKQIRSFIAGFKARVAELAQCPRVRSCPACQEVGSLKIKTIVHFGEAVFSQVGEFTKIAGPDIIKAHRLLKNSIKEDEYILMTSECFEVSENAVKGQGVWLSEHCEGFGDVCVLVQFPESTHNAREVTPRIQPLQYVRGVLEESDFLPMVATA